MYNVLYVLEKSHRFQKRHFRIKDGGSNLPWIRFWDGRTAKPIIVLVLTCPSEKISRHCLFRFYWLLKAFRGLEKFSDGQFIEISDGKWISKSQRLILDYESEIWRRPSMAWFRSKWPPIAPNFNAWYLANSGIPVQINEIVMYIVR